jgi:3-phenylpropionate/trans-cinnamate dioxygenase ferredoxin reductase component
LAIVGVGAGIAAVRFVQRLRARGATDEVVLVGAEAHLPYDRPPLSKQVLRGECELPELVTPEALRALSVSLRLAVTATGLDPEGRRLHTDSGDLDYDVLVIATGARALRVPGLSGHVLRTWDDAARLRGEVRPGAVLAVIGAGLIGCEVAASSRALGAEVHLIDVADSPMARVVGPELSELVSDLHRRHGVQLHLGTGVVSADAAKLTMGDGTVLAPDVLLHAVGARPDTTWLAGAGLDGVNGVPCDQTGATAVADVYAIGDVAAWAGRRAEHWMSATAQADRVAALLTGQDPPQPDVSYWWSDQYDVKFQGLGNIEGADDVRIRHWGHEQRPVALYGREGKLVAAVGMSAGGAVMRLRADIAAGTPLNDVDARLS